MSCTCNAPSDITSPDGFRQVNVFGSGSLTPKAMVALNSQVALSGYRATPVRRSFLTTPLNSARSPEQMGKLSLAVSQRVGKPGADGRPAE